MDNHTIPPTLPSADTLLLGVENELIRAELVRRRLMLGRSVRSLAIPGRLSAQTIHNIEKGKHSPTIRTLSLLCGQFGLTLKELVCVAIA
ncbi:MAG: helix-turn-helix transcriptional regulator [Verrucomicrobiaceae bacterium]|nr:helix-turn-helix transcriptional regulator [Verrucomicrobiaceae bacterium]